MKKALLTALIILFASPVLGQNPDGKLGSSALEPFINWIKAGALDQRTQEDVLIGGIRIIIPTTEKTTFFMSASFGQMHAIGRKDVSITISFRIWSN